MNYLSGVKVLIGDRVDLGGGMSGTVVGSIDDDEYLPDFPKSAWGELKVGILVKSDQAGVIHFTEPNEDLVLVERARPHS